MAAGGEDGVGGRVEARVAGVWICAAWCSCGLNHLLCEGLRMEHIQYRTALAHEQATQRHGKHSGRG